jgi:hypothetical protein
MPGNTFDLQLICAGMTADALATDLVSQASALPDFRVSRDSGAPVLPRQFEIVRFTSTYAYGAGFLLDRKRLLVMFLSDPESTTPERARDCAIAFHSLFSLIQSPTGAKPRLVPKDLNENSIA